MDRKFDTGNFERLLREKADEFKMYPSKRVWHGIYNSLHPGRRWPSVATSILLITCLLFVGYINTDTTGKAKTIKSFTKQTPGQSSAAIPVIAALKLATTNHPAAITHSNATTNTNQPAGLKSRKQLAGKKFASNNTITRIDQPATGNIITRANTKEHTGIAATEKSFPVENIYATSYIVSREINRYKNYAAPKHFATIASGNRFTAAVTIADETADLDDINTSTATTLAIAETTTDKKETAVTTNGLSNEEKAWIENYALQNLPTRRKWVDKVGVQLYAAPAVVYRNLSENFLQAGGSGAEINNSVHQKPALGLEAGAAMQYALSEILKVKAGLQFNFSRYNIKAFETNHPIATTITMNDLATHTPYTVAKTSPYSNSYGIMPITLQNRTYQFSVPVGVEVKLFGNRNIQWNVGATIQPTLVMGNNAFLLSTDRHNYVNESSLINDWNLNGGFETFISYKVNGLTWQLGPQVRYQFFSTYGKKYSIAENLFNYGLKIGVSRNLR